MAAFPRPSTPAAAWRDLRAFMATRQKHQLLFAALAIAIPTLIVIGFLIGPTIARPTRAFVYAQSWPADRSDAQIIAQQKIDAVAERRAKAELATAQAARRAEFQRLKDRLGMR